MNNYIKIVFLVAIFVALSAGQSCDEKGMRIFDKKIHRLVTIAGGRQLPMAKGAPLKKWCDESDRINHGLEEYKDKCFKNLPKQVFGVLIYSLKNTLNQYCKKDSQKVTNFISAIPCVKKHDKTIVTKCYTNLIDGMLGAQNAQDKLKIPYLCCDYAMLFTCFDNKLTPAPGCNEKNVEAVKDFVGSIVGNVINLICGDYVEGSDKCKSLGATPKKKKSQRRPKSFGPAILDLLSSFPEV